MKCPRCQHKNRPGAKFCEECAAPLARACVNCRAQLSATAKFCSECAHPAGPAVPQASPRFGAPDAYTPKHLAERIISSKAALEGERKEVTVLFADLKGSLELLADRDAEDVRQILDPVLERMMEAVHHYEGTVNQVMGDGIMALFGAPIAHEDHAVRACYAALRMQATVAQYADELMRSERAEVRIRAGLNSGEVVVRSIGSDLRMDYTAVGTTTHLAARMEQLARPGSSLVTAETLRLVEDYIEARSVGPLPVKGLAHPIEAFELSGARTVRSRLQTASMRGLTKFVGREAEFDRLKEALERAWTGHGQVVAIVGDAGVGKSRLCWEFTRSHNTQGWRVLESGSLAYGRPPVLLPVADLLRTFFRIEPRDDCAEIRANIMAKLHSVDPALESSLTALLSLIDVPVDDRSWEQLDPQQRRQRTLESVKRLLLRDSHTQPLLILLEDLQWSDSETEAFLGALIEGLRTARILLVATFRPEFEPKWADTDYCQRLRIDPLPPPRTEELLQALLGDAVELQPLKRLLIERTQGNPFFLEESVRMLIETRALVGDRGAYCVVKDVTTMQIAPTIKAVLSARIDRLSPVEKSLLQCASVVGKDVPVAILNAVAELREDELHHSLTHLSSTGFLYEASQCPALTYTFKHALTHEVAYGTLLHARRTMLHAKIVDAMERLYVDRLSEHVDRLADHAVRGEIWGKALTYLSQAGAKAAARSANREAVARFEQALVAMQHLAPIGDVIERAIDLRLDLRNALLQLGQPASLINYLREAEALARKAGDDRRLGRVLASLAHYFWLTAEYEQALNFGAQALGIAAALRDLALEVTTNYYLGLACYYLGLACYSLGDYRRGSEILRQNVKALGGGLLRERFGTAGSHSVFARGWLVSCLAELGDFVEAEALGEEGVRIAEAVGEPFTVAQAYLGIASVHVRRGTLDRATSALERAVTLCQAADIKVLMPRVMASLGYGYTLVGRVQEAIPLLEQAVDRAYSIPVVFLQASAQAFLGVAYLAAGRLEEAMAAAQCALAHARDRKEIGHEAWTLRLLAEILMVADCHGSRDDAAEHYGEAMTIAQRLGMKPLLAHCLLGLGTLHRRKGMTRDAEECFRAADRLVRDMDMRLGACEARQV
jgi:class 3 adenylate cyclase/tetratricopeptide (TPR) repeat protein